jgi:hypothetical protein
VSGTGQARQEQEAQVIDAGDGLGPDRRLDAGDLCFPAGNLT